MKRFLLLLLLLLSVPQVAAQDNPITWTVVPGYNGTFKSGAWIPITVTIANSGNDLQGRLEWRWETGGTSFAQTVDLPRGAKKRIVLPVVADTFGREGSVELVASNRAVAREQVRYNQVDASTLVVGIVSEASNALAELSGLRSPFGQATLVRLEPEELPERWELLQSLDMLFVHDTDTAAWNDAQRTALALWVAEGGRLVVGGDRATTSAGVGAILPAAAKDSTRDAPLAAFAGTGWRPRDPRATIKVLALSPGSGVEVVAATPEGTPLLVRRAHGRGQVLQAAFDLQALNAQADTVPLWERLLPLPNQQPEWSRLRSNAQGVLRDALALPTLRLPPISGLLVFLALYIVLVGPVNYLILRRLDRREWAYLTIPLTVLVFTAGAYSIGAAGRGGKATATALTVVHAAPGSTTGHGLSYVGLFSPVRRNYQVKLARDALVSNASPMFDRSTAMLQVVQGESSVEVPSFLVDVGALRPLLAEQTAPAPDVRASLSRSGGQLTLDVENRSAGLLADVAVMVGDSVQKLEDFGPGERRNVQLDQNAFFGQIPFQTGGVINRSAAVNALRNRSFVVVEPAVPAAPPPPPVPEPTVPLMPLPPADVLPPPMPPVQPVTLLAWSTGPQVEVALDDRPLEVQGDTLYMWTVGEAR